MLIRNPADYKKREEETGRRYYDLRYYGDYCERGGNGYSCSPQRTGDVKATPKAINQGICEKDKRIKAKASRRLPNGKEQ